MAQRTITTLLDDLTPEVEATDTILFGLDGDLFEIDLSADHARELRETYADYISHGRSVKSLFGKKRGRPHKITTGTVNTHPTHPNGDASKPAAKPTPKPTVPEPRPPTDDNGKADPKAVREWARANGMKVAARGRLAPELVAKFQAAMAKPAKPKNRKTRR